MVDPLAEYNMPQYILREFKVVLVVDVDDNDDNNNDAVDCDNDDDDGEKSSVPTSELSAGGAK